MLGIFKRSAREQIAAPEQIAIERPTSVPSVRSRSGAIAKHMTRAFDAGQVDRLTASWPATPMPADDIIRRHQRILVARSREQATNNDYGKSFLRMVRQNVVGPTGVRLQAQSRDSATALDAKANDAIEAAFRDWSRAENCDVTGRQSWRALQAALVTSAAKDGEFMLRKIYGRDAGPWGFALHVLDPQRCPVDHDEDRRADGTFVRHGIEFNKYGRPLAFYFTTTDERETDYWYGGRRFTRIPADEIIHGFLSDMIGQKRGLPWMATALWRMQMLGGFEKAALVNARVAASKGGFFQWKEGYGPEQDEDEELVMDAEPGSFQELPAGAEFKEWNPQYPSGEFSPFIKAALRGISSGLGVAYNNLANDLEGVNFSSIRQGTLDEREHWKELQEWLIEQLIDPVFQAWLPIALLSGRITIEGGGTLRADRLQKYRAVSWQPRRWQWIDPRADVAAAIEMKNNLMGSFGQFIRDQGRDPDTVWREVAQDIEQMRKAGIPDEFIMQAMGRKLAPAGAEPAGGQDATA